tara:strand:- start:115 stop:267 length:153 start_codon:yes stop_codon:yes gene_type:complete
VDIDIVIIKKEPKNKIIYCKKHTHNNKRTQNIPEFSLIVNKIEAKEINKW